MTPEQTILSDIVVHMKYAKYIPTLNRRENWSEICDRYENMLIHKFPKLKEDIWTFGKLVRVKKILPSMRALQFAGKAVETNNSRLYNCCYMPIDDYHAFSEIMFLLLSGCGTGYSVQTHHVDKLPPIKKPTSTKKFVVQDSIEGWADAIKALMKSYLGYDKYLPLFNFSEIREKGAVLVISGGKAPGPEPLQRCIELISEILSIKSNGERLTALECHDILCHLANAVLAGGIRRAAMIALFSPDDDQMLKCKSGSWWEKNEQRGRANNSAALLRQTTTRQDFNSLWKAIEESRAGEPGFAWTNDLEIGGNPCFEISLYPFQFCNLCEINVADVDSQEDFEERIVAATFFGTLQASYTDFHYLRPIWKEVTEKQALIGISMTGIAANKIAACDLPKGAAICKKTNADIAQIIGINPSARCTTIKPAGTTSLTLGTSSGVHAWHNDYYLRSIRVGKNEAIYTYLKETVPALIEDDIFNVNQAVIRIPQKAPEGAVFRNETALTFLERVRRINQEWVHAGHNYGINYNNVSATVSIRHDEWNEVEDWMWKNRECYSGLSVLPYDGGTYVQAPFENISAERYQQLVGYLAELNVDHILEFNDNTAPNDQVACAGGACEIM